MQTKLFDIVYTDSNVLVVDKGEFQKEDFIKDCKQ